MMVPSWVGMLLKYAERRITKLATVPKSRRTCRTAEGQTAHDLRDGCAESHPVSQASGLKHSAFRSRRNPRVDQTKKTSDLRDRRCYHPPRSLGGCNAQGEHHVSLQTRKERHALALLLPSAWRPLPRRNFRGTDEEAGRTSGE